jgi:hypothetical protein
MRSHRCTASRAIWSSKRIPEGCAVVSPGWSSSCALAHDKRNPGKCAQSRNLSPVGATESSHDPRVFTQSLQAPHKRRQNDACLQPRKPCPVADYFPHSPHNDLTAVSELLYSEATGRSGLFLQEKAALNDSGNGYINSEAALNPPRQKRLAQALNPLPCRNLLTSPMSGGIYIRHPARNPHKMRNLQKIPGGVGPTRIPGKRINSPIKLKVPLISADKSP